MCFPKREEMRGSQTTAAVSLCLSLVLTGCATGPKTSHPLPAPALLAETPAPGETAATARTAAWFEAHRGQPPRLRTFVQRMPKGGDLHSHLGGAVYAESYLRWAAAGDYCVARQGDDLRLDRCAVLGQGEAEAVPAAEALADSHLYHQLIDQMSTRHLAFADRSGRDDFFASFRQFSPVTRTHRGEMLAEVAARAASEHTQYLELMLTLGGGTPFRLGREIGLGPDLDAVARQLLEAGLRDHVATSRRELDASESTARDAMRCGLEEEDPGCAVTRRYIQQIIRTRPPAEVFAQLVHAFELIRADPRVVGLNLVAPEDDPVARRDYTRHMEMLDFLASRAPDVAVTLHAGELALGMVPPEDLRFHIRQAIELGHARRIGHGTSIAYEDDALGLLSKMRQRGVLVEICLSTLR